MNFNNNQIKEFPTEDDILNLISEQDIFEYYLGSLPVKLINSPLRNDKIPSFGLFLSKKYNKVLYKDLATGDVGNCFVFVKKLFGFSRISDAYNKVAYDFTLTQFRFVENIIPSDNNFKLIKKSKRIISKESIDIKIKIREWNQEDINYWHLKYGITKKMLNHCNVYPISHYFLNNYLVKVKGIAYAFVENKDGIQTYKIYQPFEENKWINNNNYSVWELWKQLPYKGENLIITSSRKDAMVIKSLFNNEFVASCSLQGENFKPKRTVMEELSKRFKNKFILYDNDKYKLQNWGKIAASKICEEYSDLDFKQIEIDNKYEPKDISDFREEYGREITKQLILELIC